MGIISIFITSCSNLPDRNEHIINVQKRIGNEHQYEDFKEVDNNEQVQNAREILDTVDWENAEVTMAHPADYRFTFQNTNQKNKTKGVLYYLWISPNKDKVELTIHNQSKYAQLDITKSADLFEIVTGERLSEID